MYLKRVFLDKDDERVYLDIYPADGGSGDAVIIAPGGGYCMVCHDREGEPIALEYNKHGISAFVVNYRVGTMADVYPRQLIDISRAILYVRENSWALGINPNRVFTLGFSAGGHLAGSAAVLYRDAEVLDTLGVSADMIKPNGAILCYPVVSAMENTHVPSFENLKRMPFDKIDEATRKYLSLECAIDKETPPLFIWHTARDMTVPAVGSIRLAERGIALGLNVSLHIYPYGPHGVALGNEVTSAGISDYIQPLAEGWVADSVKWLKTI